MVKTLVVDDDPELLAYVAELLRQAGHDVTTAVEGFDAYDLLMTGSFDLCVLDHELPNLTGLQVAGALRVSRPKTRVILVTGSERVSLDNDVLAGRVDHVVRKPFSPDDLLVAIDRLLAT